MLLPRWFLILNGIALLLLGGMLFWLRLRPQPGDEPAPARSARQRLRFLTDGAHMVGLLWALICCGVGAGLLAMASGRLSQPGSRDQEPALQSRGRRSGPVFPTDR